MQRVIVMPTMRIPLHAIIDAGCAPGRGERACMTMSPALSSEMSFPLHVSNPAMQTHPDPASVRFLSGRSFPLGFITLLLALVWTSACAGSGVVKDHPCDQADALCREEKVLQHLNSEMISLVKGKYASYAADDPAYVGDLVRYLVDEDAAWRKHRDAKCTLAPFLDGMARRESYALTLQCQVDATKQRAESVRSEIERAKGI